MSDFGGESSSALIARNSKKFGSGSNKWNRKEGDKSESVKCYKCNESGHIAKHCYNKNVGEKRGSEGSKSKSSFCSVFSAGSVNPNAWYFDSGATSHMTKNKSWLKNLHEMKDTVNVANNTKE